MCPCSEQFGDDKDKLNVYLESQKKVINESIIGTCNTCVENQKACECGPKKELEPMPKVGSVRAVDVGEATPIIIEEGTDVIYTETYEEMTKRVEKEVKVKGYQEEQIMEVEASIEEEKPIILDDDEDDNLWNF